MQNVRSLLKNIAKGLALISILLITVCAIEVNHILRPERIVPQGNTLRKFDIPYEEVQLVTADGIRLAAWYTPPRNGAVILLAHGFGDYRPEWVSEMLARTGYGVLAWDARAHGESEGTLSTIGYLEVLDVQSALGYALTQPGVRHIGAWGGSMGAVTIIRAAAEYPQIEAIFVDSPFASLDDELDYLLPYPLLNPLAKILAQLETGVRIQDINPLADIARISPRPVFIVQGLADTVTPPDSGQRLFDAAGEPKILWAEENVPHLQMFLDNPRRYKRRLIEFFDTWLLND